MDHPKFLSTLVKWCTEVCLKGIMVVFFGKFSTHYTNYSFIFVLRKIFNSYTVHIYHEKIDHGPIQIQYLFDLWGE